MVSIPDAIGLAAGFLVAIGWVPQILRVWKLGDAHEISLSFNLLALGGTSLWFAYGALLSLSAVIVWNGINLILLSALLLVKLRYGMGKRRLPSPPS